MVSLNLQLVKMSFSVDRKTFQLLLQPSLRKPCRHLETPPLVSSRNLPRTQTSLFWWKCARKGRREGDNRRDVASPAVSTLPMVPCGSSQVTRFALASAMRKTKRLRKRLSRNDIQATTAKIRLFSSGLSQPFLHGRLLFFHIYLQQWLVFDMTIMKPELLDYKISL